MIRSRFGEIVVSEMRKSKNDEQPKNREPELEERELKWPKKQFEIERRKRMKIEEEKKELETKVQCLEKEVTELSKSSFCLKQEKKKIEKTISDLTNKVEEGAEKEKDLFREIEGLVDELVKEKKDTEILTQQRNSLDVNLNQVQQEAVNLRHTIETLSRDKTKMEKTRMLAVKVVVDLRRELNKLNEAMKSESSIAENWKNERWCHRWDVLEKIQMKSHKRRTIPFFCSRKRRDN